MIKLLGNNQQSPDLPEYFGSDTKELHKMNCLKLGTRWKYYNKKVIYNLNKHKFRAPEFDDVQWDRSIAVFGCSNIFGTGQLEEETIPTMISQYTDRPVINMGVGGLGCDGVAHNVAMLKKMYDPFLCFVVWPERARFVYKGGAPASDTLKDYRYMTSWEATNKTWDHELKRIGIEPRAYITSNELIEQVSERYKMITEMLPNVYTIGDKHNGFGDEFYSHSDLTCDTQDWNVLIDNIGVANLFLSRDLGWNKQRKSWYGHLGSEQNLMLTRKFMSALPKEVRALM